MKKLAALLLLAVGCSPTAYYVANVYNDGQNLYTERCAIDSGRYSDKPDPNNCRIERVGDLPPGLRGMLPPSASPRPVAPAMP